MKKLILPALVGSMLIFAQASTAQQQSEADQPGKQPKDSATRTGSNLLQDGTYTVVDAEMNGQKIDSGPNARVTISNGMVSFRHQGKECRMKLELMAQGRARATDVVLADNAIAGDNQPRTTAQAERRDRNRPGQEQEANDNAKKHDKGNFDGVYIKTNDFLCLCLHGDKEGRHIETSNADRNPKNDNRRVETDNADRNAKNNNRIVERGASYGEQKQNENRLVLILNRASR